MCIALALFFYCRRRGQAGPEQIEMAGFDYHEGAALRSNQAYDGADDALLNYENYFGPSMTLDRTAVTLDKVIGSGNFGTVYIGTARIDDASTRGSGSGDGESCVVQAAIKQPSYEARDEFELEMATMSKIETAGGHQNIVKVLG